MSLRSFSVTPTVSSYDDSKRRRGAASLLVSMWIAVGIEAGEESSEILDSDKVECAAIKLFVTEADSWGNGDSNDNDLFQGGNPDRTSNAFMKQKVSQTTLLQWDQNVCRLTSFDF